MRKKFLFLLSLAFCSFTFAKPADTPSLPPVPPQLEAHYQALEVLTKGLFYIENLYVDPAKVEIKQLVNNALVGVLATLDPHSVYISSEAFQQLGMKTKGVFGGVGIIISTENEKLVVVSVIEESPAEKVGIKAGDQIINIDGREVPSPPGEATYEQVQGEPGSKVRLTILRKREKRQFTLRREIITVKSFQAYELDEQIYYGKLASFQSTTSDELAKFFVANSSKIKGFILDLRDNPGGLLDQAVKVADLFIEKGLIVSTIGRDPDKIEQEFSQSNLNYAGFPMIVLINGGSASASEIVAGALQDHRRALILGTKSFGKGSVQTLVALPNGDGLKITIARYYTPNNRSIQAVGIIPDIVVNKEQLAERKGKKMREADLAGHIEGANLQGAKSGQGMGEETREKWPEKLREDLQLFHAYTYLKGWSVFKFGPRPPV
jgi:carboxyl-terminal processing protease